VVLGLFAPLRGASARRALQSPPRPAREPFIASGDSGFEGQPSARMATAQVRFVLDERRLLSLGRGGSVLQTIEERLRTYLAP
jgi:hypothetical protein